MAAKWRAAAYTGRKDRKIRRRGLGDVSNQSSFCPDPRRLAQPLGVGQSYARQPPTHWKAANRHSCHNRPPCRRFSWTFVSDPWRNRARKRRRSRYLNTDEFEERLKALRPRLHRYCARMTGSAVNGEDVLQDTLVKALHARAQGAGVDNLEGWLFRIAHNASLDFLRDRSRNTVVPLTEDVEAAPIPEADIVAISFQTFLRLPELQRCGVILKDFLGHSFAEIQT